MSTAPKHTSASEDETVKSTADAGLMRRAGRAWQLTEMKLAVKWPLLAVIAGTAVIGLAAAGCGGSGGHASQWTTADVQKLESALQEPEKLPPAMVACLVPTVEKRISPKASSAEGERVGREAMASCEKSVNHVTVPSGAQSGSSGEKQYGPACQKQLESAACVEEQEQKVGQAEAEGEAKVSEEQKNEQQEYEQQQGDGTATEEP